MGGGEGGCGSPASYMHNIHIILCADFLTRIHLLICCTYLHVPSFSRGDENEVDTSRHLAARKLQSFRADSS